MSLEKAIHHGKEKRRPYPPHDSRNFDWSCRNHKSCSWCRRNRTYQRTRLDEQARQEMREC
jgi:hypothetical protein